MLLKSDRMTLIKTEMAVDHDGEIRIRSEQDAKAIVEQNRAEFNAHDERSRWKGDWHHVARIPMVLFFQLKDQGVFESAKSFGKWLNDPDNRFFRTRPGRL